MTVAVHVEGPSGEGEVLVLGHSLGTAAALWEHSRGILEDRFRVITWEVPGHGSAPPARARFRVEELTDELVARLDALGVGAFHYAGVSVSGCVGLDLALRHADRVASLAVASSGARLADPSIMIRRAAAVRQDGVASLVEPFRSRWLAPTTPDDVADRLLGLLRATDQESYALTAEALAAFDVADRMREVRCPLLAVAGERDEVVPPVQSEELARSAPRGATAIIPRAAHSVVGEQPRLVAEALIAHILAAR